MERNQTVTNLMQACTQYFEKSCYTRLRIECYKSMWKNGIYRYTQERGIPFYNSSIASNFIQDTISSQVTHSERDVIRSKSVITEMQQTDKVSKKSVPKISRNFIGAVGEIINLVFTGITSSTSV